MLTFNAGYATNRQRRFTWSGADRVLGLARLTRCRRFGPSPCPTHYGGHLATMPSADFCPITPDVASKRAARVAVGSGGDSRAFTLALRPAPVATTAPLGFDGDSSPFEPGLSSTPLGTRAASEKDLPNNSSGTIFRVSPPRMRVSLMDETNYMNMNFPCTTAAFPLSPVPVRLCHLVLTRPGIRPSIRFLFVGSHLCARASSRQPFADLPLPSAGSYRPLREHRYSYRGLSPISSCPCRAYTIC